MVILNKQVIYLVKSRLDLNCVSTGHTQRPPLPPVGERYLSHGCDSLLVRGSFVYRVVRNNATAEKLEPQLSSGIVINRSLLESTSV